MSLNTNQNQLKLAWKISLVILTQGRHPDQLTGLMVDENTISITFSYKIDSILL